MSETKARKPKAATKLDIDAKTLTYTPDGGDTVVFDLGKLPANSMLWAAARGITARMSKSKTPASDFDNLVAGIIPAERAGRSNREPSLHEKAIALAIRDELAEKNGVKKSDKAAYAGLLDEAAAMVAKMDKAKKAAARQSAAVIAFIASLKRTTQDQTSLLDLAA